MNDVLELEIRRKIYDLLMKNPGLHAHKIAALLSISGQLCDYHLLYLERYDIISATKEEGFRRYYVKGALGIKDRRRISILLKETPLRIVLFLLQHPHSTHSEILTAVPVVKSTLSYHLTNLLEYQIITMVTMGNEKRYVVASEREIIELLIKYKPYSRIDSFKDTWVDMKWPGAP